jgi:hypothetical protein
VLDVIEQVRKRRLAQRSSVRASKQPGLDFLLGSLCPLPSRKVDREADRQRDEDVDKEDEDVLVIADDQCVVGRNEEEVNDKIGSKGGR